MSGAAFCRFTNSTKIFLPTMLLTAVYLGGKGSFGRVKIFFPNMQIAATLRAAYNAAQELVDFVASCLTRLIRSYKSPF